LSFDDEVKQLEAIRLVNDSDYGQIVPTFLGAHAVPGQFYDDKEAYIDIIVNKMIPYIAKQRLAEFVDVFCEGGVFDVIETKRILLKV